MDLFPDFKEFLALLAEEGVDHLVCGGYAVAAHGYPRYTGDLDIWVGRQPANITKLLKALQRFGAGEMGLELADFLHPAHHVFRIGASPVRLDLMMEVKGLTFLEALQHKMVEPVGDLLVPFLSLQDLILSKRAAARPKDLADLAALCQLPEPE